MIYLKRYFLSIALAVSLSCSSLAAEQEIRYITLDMAIDMALDRNEDVKIRQESLQKLMNMYKEVRSSVFPQVTGTVNVNWAIEAPVIDIDMGSGSMSIPLVEEWETSVGLQVTQVLWAFGKVKNAVVLARNYLDMEEHSGEVTARQLEYAVKKLYYTLLLAREVVGICIQSHENALMNQKALKERFSSGRVSRVNNVKMNADVASRVPRVLDAEKSLRVVEVAMKDILGVSQDQEIVLSDPFRTDFPESDLERMKTAMMQNEPVLLVYRARLSLADTQIKLKRSSFFPTLSGFLTYSYSGGDDKLIPDVMKKEVIAGVTLSHRIFTSGALRSSYRQAKNDREIARLEYQKMSSSREVELRSAVEEYKALVKTYSANRTATELARDAYDITLSSFRSGAVGQTVLNDAEIQLTAAKLAEASTLYNINVSMARIENLINQRRLR